MLKWTASAQKLPQDTTVTSRTLITGSTPRFPAAKRCKRRATIANKENIHTLTTSTPVVNRTRNSPLVMTPLADILNVTPENLANGRTKERRRVSFNAIDVRNSTTKRRHSSVGFSIPQMPQYAATLPKYEEEYSPSNILPTGQQLALRGFLPDPFMANHRYFATPNLTLEQKSRVQGISSLTKRRKLEQEFVLAAKEVEESTPNNIEQTPKINKKDLNQTGLVSNKMGDQTLDNLIDAILDSARKEEKKKKPRRSFNLRRRTLLKNHIEQPQDVTLSPSYAAGDDPCSDLNFLGCEPLLSCNANQCFENISPRPVTPQPATPLPDTLLKQRILLELPTPPRRRDSFSLDTPVRTKLKRRSESSARPDKRSKKYKVDAGNYFEIGVALPSIYV